MIDIFNLCPDINVSTRNDCNLSLQCLGSCNRIELNTECKHEMELKINLWSNQIIQLKL